MWIAEIKYTETVSFRQTSITSKHDYIDQAQDWAEEMRKGGFWHTDSEDEEGFVPSDNIHRMTVRRVKDGE